MVLSADIAAVLPPKRVASTRLEHAIPASVVGPAATETCSSGRHGFGPTKLPATTFATEAFLEHQGHVDTSMAALSSSSAESCTSQRSPVARQRCRQSSRKPLTDSVWPDNTLQEYGHDIFESMTTNESRFRTVLKLDAAKTLARLEAVQAMFHLAVKRDVSMSAVFIAVANLNRYLHIASWPSPRDLSTAAAACLFTASKFEDESPLAVKHVLQHYQNLFTSMELYMVEVHILELLQYQIAISTSYSFRNHLLAACKRDDHTNWLSAYLLELSLLDPRFVSIRPSVVAASAICYAGNLVGGDGVPWSVSLQRSSGLRLKQLQPCLEALDSMILLVNSDLCPSSMACVVKKYFGSKSV